MLELFRDHDISKVSYYQSVLEAKGIQTFVRNENVSAAEGRVSPAFLPALCVVSDGDYEEAVTAIKELLDAPPEPAGPDLVCSFCGETRPSNFPTCWNCGKS